MRTYRAVGLMIVATLTVVILGVVPASAAPTMTATPTGGLVDGSFVEVSLSGFAAGDPLVVTQCTAPQSNCRDLFFHEADATGSLHVTVRIFALLDAPGGSVDCRTTPTCVLDAYQGGGTTGPLATPLAFTPGAPLAAAPTFAIAPRTGLRQGDPITLSGAGLNPDTDIPVYRCPTTFTTPTSVACDVSPTSSTTLVVHTDPTGAFTKSVPFDATFTSDAFVSPFPLPAPPCGSSHCVTYALTPSFPNWALTAAVDFLAAPTIRVGPDSGLVDGSFVTVRGSDFEPNAVVIVDECGSASGPCRSLRILNADASGHFDTVVRVFAVIDGEGRQVDCRVVPATCAIGAHQYGDDTDTYRAPARPVSFDPTGALAPAPTFTVMPDRGVVAGTQLTITGTGLNPVQTLSIHECPLIGPGGRCALDPVTTVQTDAAGAFRVSVAFPLLTQSHQSWIPAPAAEANRTCETGEMCEYLGIYPAGPKDGMLATLGLETTIAPAPSAIPVVATAPFAG